MSIFIAGLLGLAVGSFLNVLTMRMMRGESFVAGRSRCPHCQTTLRAVDTIPVLSFLLLKGKCRFCQTPISWQYPAVELATACAFALVVALYPTHDLFYPYVLKDLIITTGLITLFIFDVRWYAVPDSVALPVAFGAAALNYGLGMPFRSLVFGMLLGAGFFAFFWLVSRGRWVGDGDIRLGAVVGAVAGWPNTFAALYIAYVVGGIVAIALVLSGKKELGSILPMGAFLMAAAFVVLLYPERVAALSKYFFVLWN